VAKTLLLSAQENLGLRFPSDPKSIWIHRTEAGWPQVRNQKGEVLPLCLSIGHTQDLAVAGVCHESSGKIGMDLESIAPRSQAFIDDFFSDREAADLGRQPGPDRDFQATVYWTVKEAILKARCTGLTENSKIIEVTDLDSTPIRPAHISGRFLESDLHSQKDSLSSPTWRKASVQMSDKSQPMVFWKAIDNQQLVLTMAMQNQPGTLSSRLSERSVRPSG
jgi:phosphopantetheinyl transferase